jgi:hypothetical protein
MRRTWFKRRVKRFYRHHEKKKRRIRYYNHVEAKRQIEASQIILWGDINVSEVAEKTAAVTARRLVSGAEGGGRGCGLE